MSRKKIDLSQLVRPNISIFTPYSSARSLFTKGMLMDANENPYNLFSEQIHLNRYPDSNYVLLRKRAAEGFGISVEECAVGSGSDELLDLLFRIFCRPGRDQVLLAPPTYGNYQVLANINDSAVVNVPLEDFQLNVDGILRSMTQRVKLVFICSPNNPTGNTFRREDILRVVKEVNAIVVLDEAYAEFMDEPSLIPEIRRSNNLVVLRTLSKAFALAGARLGFACADSEIIELIQKVKLPYNVSILAVEQGLKAVENQREVHKHVRGIIEERERLSKELAGVPGVTEVFPSQANFILFRINKADLIFKKLIEKEIVVRNRSNVPQLENCLRVTVGNPEQNAFFLKNLKDIASQL